MPHSAELFRSSNLLVDYQLGSIRPEVLMVLFPQLDEQQSLLKPGFGTNLYTKLNQSFVSIKCATNGWFQYSEIEDACAAIRAVSSQYPHVVTYGSSMGGYGALAFAKSVGATCSIAIAPQFSVDPAVVPFENRWNKYRRQIDSFPFDNLPDRILTGRRSFVFYDPFDERDALHVARIRQVADIVPIRASFGGHLCGELLTQTGLLRPSVDAIVSGTFDLQDFAIQLRRKRGSLHRPWAMLEARATRQGKTRLAQWAAERAAEI